MYAFLHNVLPLVVGGAAIFIIGFAWGYREGAHLRQEIERIEENPADDTR